MAPQARRQLLLLALGFRSADLGLLLGLVAAKFHFESGALAAVAHEYCPFKKLMFRELLNFSRPFNGFPHF